MKVKTLLLPILAVTNVVYAENFYAGIDYQTSATEYSNDTVVLSSGESFAIEHDQYYEDSFSNFSPFIGYNISNKYSLELSYFQQSESKTNNNTGLAWVSDSALLVTQSEIDIKAISLDGMKNFDFPEYDTSLSAIVGISHIKSEVKNYYLGNGSVRESGIETEKSTSLNLGFQAKYNISDNFFARAKFRYSFVQDIDNLDNISNFNIGMGYNF